MQVRTAIVAAAAALSLAGPAAAQDAPPDITGVWTGTFTGGVRSGGGQLAPADREPPLRRVRRSACG